MYCSNLFFYLQLLRLYPWECVQSTYTFRKICSSLLVVLVALAWVYHTEKEHAEHNAHLMHENDGKLPDPPAYQYLNVRVKPFPWGPNSLFFNPKVRLSIQTL